MSGSIDKPTIETLTRQMGGSETVGKIVHMYVEKLPTEIETLQSELTAGDLEAVQASAHRLKSSSGQLGAKRLAVMLAGLEGAGREGDADAAGRILNEVALEAGKVRAELDEIGS